MCVAPLELGCFSGHGWTLLEERSFLVMPLTVPFWEKPVMFESALCLELTPVLYPRSQLLTNRHQIQPDLSFNFCNPNVFRTVLEDIFFQ